MLSRTTRISVAIALAASALAGVAQPAAAQASDFNCWTRGAYLEASGNFGHHSVCNGSHVAVVTLKRDGVAISSYTSTLSGVTASGNHMATSFRRSNVQCARRYQVVVQIYRQPIAVALGTVPAAQYWTSGTPRILCHPVASSASSPPS